MSDGGTPRTRADREACDRVEESEARRTVEACARLVETFVEGA